MSAALKVKPEPVIDIDQALCDPNLLDAALGPIDMWGVALNSIDLQILQVVRLIGEPT